MPNWCMNVVEVTHNDLAQLAVMKEAALAGKLFQTFVPCPQKLLDTVSCSSTGNDTELEKLYTENEMEFGHANWYEWNCANWGTKWDACYLDDNSDIRDDVLHMKFDTAWSPPISFYFKLKELGFKVKAYYFEPGMNVIGKYDDGILQDYSEMDFDDIPTELVEVFNLTEHFDA